MTLKDSGARREFDTGAVRDISEMKGRCDLMPLDLVARFTIEPESDSLLLLLERFQRTGNPNWIRLAIEEVVTRFFPDKFTAFLELAIHYQEGSTKYTDRNWELGMPIHCFIDSAVRHYLKQLRGDTDEPHHRALLWNLFGAWWMLLNHNEMNDLPVAKGDTK